MEFKIELLKNDIKININDNKAVTLKSVNYTPIFGMVAIIEELGSGTIWNKGIAHEHIDDSVDKIVDRVKEFIN